MYMYITLRPNGLYYTRSIYVHIVIEFKIFTLLHRP